MKRFLTFVAILIVVGVVYSLIARERSILRAAEERARRAEVSARNALERARQPPQALTPTPTPAYALPPQAEPAVSQQVFEPTPVFAPFSQVDPVNGLEALRQQYVQQQAVKALLMQAEDLRSALDATNSEIRELDAQAKLKEVSETLAGIVEDFNGTQAAPLAEQMLELYRNPPQDAEDGAEAAEAAEPSPAQEAEPAPAAEPSSI